MIKFTFWRNPSNEVVAGVIGTYGCSAESTSTGYLMTGRGSGPTKTAAKIAALLDLQDTERAHTTADKREHQNAVRAAEASFKKAMNARSRHLREIERSLVKARRARP